MSQTIPDLRQHDLSPDARVSVYRKNTQVVGYRKILSRVKGMFAVSGLSFDRMQHLTKSRAGRKHLASLVYTAVYSHYKDIGMCHSYSCARARNARSSFKLELRKQAAVLNMREAYTYDALGMKPRKDTTNPMAGCYGSITQGRPISAISPLSNLVNGVHKSNKPNRYIPNMEKPIANTEAGNIYNDDNLGGMVKRILVKDTPSLAKISYDKFCNRIA